MAVMPGGMRPPGMPPGPGGLAAPQFLMPGSPARPPLPDPSSWALAQPPPVPKKFHEEIFQYCTTEMAAGAEMVRGKLNRWLLFQKLIDGTMELSKWNSVLSAVSETTSVIENEAWQSDFVIGAASIVHSYADRLHGDLFSTDKYYLVEQQAGLAGGSTEDPVYPTSTKFQALLLNDLEYSQYKTRTYEILRDLCGFGSGFAIPFYNRKNIVRWRTHPATGQAVPVPEVQNRLVLESVPLHSIVPDVRARNSDTQRWQGVGRRIRMSYSKILMRFKQGIYNCNEKDFIREFKEGHEAVPEAYEIELWRDEALNAVMTGKEKDRDLWAWEWHGEVPVNEGPPRELINVVITNRPEDDPRNGLMTRCDHGPALPTGHRPILGCHFTPLSGVFGDGTVNPNLDLIYYMSSMINTLIDNARLSTNVQYKAKKTGSIGLDIKNRKKGNKSFPGKIWWVDNKDDIVPMESLNFPSAAMQNLVQYFEHQFERRTNVSDSTLAMSAREKTATETFSLSQSADVPLKARLAMFVENVFQPAGNIFVGMLQANSSGVMSVPVTNIGGIQTQQTITADEIRTGKYRVIAAFNKTDQLSVTKAQAMQQLTPVIFSPGVTQALAVEGRVPSAEKWIMKIAGLMGVDGLEGLFPKMPEEQAQTMRILQSLPPEQVQQLLQIIEQQEMMKKQAASQPTGGQPSQGPPVQQSLPLGQGGQPQMPGGPNGSALGTGDMSNLGHVIGMLAAAARERNQGGGTGLLQ